MCRRCERRGFHQGEGSIGGHGWCWLDGAHVSGAGRKRSWPCPVASVWPTTSNVWRVGVELVRPRWFIWSQYRLRASYACVYVATMSVCTYRYFRHVYACTEACTIKLTAVGRAASNTLLARSSAGKMDCTSMGDFKHTRTQMQQMCDGCLRYPKSTRA